MAARACAQARDDERLEGSRRHVSARRHTASTDHTQGHYMYMDYMYMYYMYMYYMYMYIACTCTWPQTQNIIGDNCFWSVLNVQLHLIDR